MRRFSYILSFLAVALFLLLAAGGAKADVIDPKIAMGGGGSCTENSQTSLTQSFTGLLTGCVNAFTNLNDVTLDTLVVNVTSPFDGQISCEVLTTAPLNSTMVSSPTSCTFFDATLIGSITPGARYGLTFDTSFGSTVDTILAQTVITPEPATLLLLGTGLAALSANRKRLKAAKHLV